MGSKKILFFVGGSYISGLEIISLQLMEALQKRGWTVRCVVNGWNDGTFKTSLEKLGIPGFESRTGWIFSRNPRWIFNTIVNWPGSARRIRKILKEFGPDICHFTDFSNPIMLYPFLKKQTCVYGLHESHAPSGRHLFFYSLLNKRMRYFIAVSRYIGDVLLALQIPPEKIRLVYNGVRTQPALTFNQRNPIVVGIIGQVGAWKGHDTLVEAIALLKEQEVTPIVVHIFGNNENAYARHLQEKIKNSGLEEHFVWRGFVVDQETVYSAVDLVAVPSLSQEPCSLTIIESMMRAKGLVVSERGGNTELVDSNSVGLTFAAGNAAELAVRLRVFIDDPTLIVRTGQAAREKALREYTIERMTNAHLQIYGELL